jgi:hypothetical protein
MATKYVLSNLAGEGMSRERKGIGMGHKMKQVLIVLVFCLGMNASAQDKGVQSFVLDQTKPYVYLKFDHIGSRTPVRDGEGNTGIWLRVVNVEEVETQAGRILIGNGRGSSSAAR